MKYNQELTDFSVRGFGRSVTHFELNGRHPHVLKFKEQNFFGPKEKLRFKFHRWAGSLKSSQALAFNLFSGTPNAKFEFEMKCLSRNPLHNACVDVALEIDNVIQMFEIKKFEIIHRGPNRIFDGESHKKYFNIGCYYWDQTTAQTFIPFLRNVQSTFRDQKIYGEGIKQLCCHVLGVINEVKLGNDWLSGKKIILNSMCFDFPVNAQFLDDLDSYKNALAEFKSLLNDYLQEIGMHGHIEYYGFYPLSEFLNKNLNLIGSCNYNYVKNRYLLE